MIICGGLSRTGTKSLSKALKILGFKVSHWEPLRLKHIFYEENPNFKVYDDVDAVLDIPAAIFYNEIAKCYPKCKFILTVRDYENWFKSVKNHYLFIKNKFDINSVEYKEIIELQKYTYGSENINKFIYVKKFQEHNELFLRRHPECLVMDISNGDGWDKLCKYLDLKIPNVPFPHENKSGIKPIQIMMD